MWHRVISLAIPQLHRESSKETSFVGRTHLLVCLFICFSKQMMTRVTFEETTNEREGRILSSLSSKQIYPMSKSAETSNEVHADGNWMAERLFFRVRQRMASINITWWLQSCSYFLFSLCPSSTFFQSSRWSSNEWRQMLNVLRST